MRLSRMISSMRARSPRPPPSASNTSAKPSRCSAARQRGQQRRQQHRDQPGRQAARQRGGQAGQREPEHQAHERKEADRAARDRRRAAGRARPGSRVRNANAATTACSPCGLPPPPRRPGAQAEHDAHRRPGRARRPRPRGAGAPAPSVAEHPPERRLGHQAHADLVADDHDVRPPRRAARPQRVDARRRHVRRRRRRTSRFEIQIVRQSTTMTSWSRSAASASGSAQRLLERVEGARHARRGGGRCGRASRRRSARRSR